MQTYYQQCLQIRQLFLIVYLSKVGNYQGNGDLTSTQLLSLKETFPKKALTLLLCSLLCYVTVKLY